MVCRYHIPEQPAYQLGSQQVLVIDKLVFVAGGFITASLDLVTSCWHLQQGLMRNWLTWLTTSGGCDAVAGEPMMGAFKDTLHLISHVVGSANFVAAALELVELPPPLELQLQGQHRTGASAYARQDSSEMQGAGGWQQQQQQLQLCRPLDSSSTASSNMHVKVGGWHLSDTQHMLTGCQAEVGTLDAVLAAAASSHALACSICE